MSASGKEPLPPSLGCGGIDSVRLTARKRHSSASRQSQTSSPPRTPYPELERSPGALAGGAAGLATGHPLPLTPSFSYKTL